MATFIILEDHAIVREGLQRTIAEHFSDADFLYVGQSLDDAIRIAEGRSVDCAVVDLDLGDGRTVPDVVSSLTAMSMPVVIVSALAESSVVQSAILAGAAAYVSKRSDTDELVRAVDAALRNEQWMSADFASSLVPRRNADVQLSLQERRALVLYASGLKLDTVARRMDVAPSTVKQYLDRVRDKYTASGKRARTKVDLYRVAQEEGFLP